MKKITKFINMLNPLRALRRPLFLLGNRLRGRKRVEYVFFTLPLMMPSLPEQRGWLRRRVLGNPPLSLYDLEEAFQQIANDPRPAGVILKLRGFVASPLADIQTLRNSILRLRQKGKKVVCYAQGYDLASYYLASAADQILLQPGGDLMTLGLRQNTVFLKDALDAVGVEIEKFAVSPYKSAIDNLARADISPEAQEQLEWLLDSRYEIIMNDIAAGRGVGAEAVHTMINNAPHVDDAALAAGYVDGILNEEALYQFLNVKEIIPWERAKKILLREWRKIHDRHVALIRIGGLIVPGDSGKPPVEIPIPLVGEERAGDLTVVQQVRRLMRDQRVGAVILFVDSPGGSATASEAMTSALAELAKDRPLVVYMNNVAASGGYYVATPGGWIVAQPGTITGSIGVVMAKALTRDAFEKLRINRLEFTRGANAGLLSDHAPLNDAQRDKLREQMLHIYRQFIQRVALSRKMRPEEVDAVGGGRVWTGKQALAHGLVDELGDLHTALLKARALANLPDDAPLVFPQPQGEPLAPKVAEEANPAAALRYVYDGIRLVCSGRSQFLMPFTLD